MTIDLLIVASPGGHLNVAREIFPNQKFSSRFVTNGLCGDSSDNVVQIRAFGRDARILLGFIDAFRIVKMLKPKVIFSSGAGIAIPFFCVGKLFGCKLIYLETASRTKSLSLTAIVVRRLCDRFYVRDALLARKVKADFYG